MIRVALALILVAIPSFLRADEAPPQSDANAEEQIVQAWGRAHETCGEWSDGCVICTQAGCSTPGIACTPREIACSKP